MAVDQHEAAARALRQTATPMVWWGSGEDTVGLPVGDPRGWASPEPEVAAP